MLHLHRKGFQGNVKNKRFIKIALFKIKNRTSSSTKSASADNMYTVCTVKTEETHFAFGSWSMGQPVNRDLWERLHHVAQRDIYVGG